MELAGRNVLVVGATGAFGSDFASRLGAAGARVSGTASSPESSVRLAADLNQRLILDLTNSASIKAVTDYLLASAEPIAGIILASGLVAFGSMAETPPEVSNLLMQVNAVGQMNLVAGLMPLLIQSAEVGHQPFVLSISGVISEMPMAGLAAYSASKTALYGYSVAAAKELKKAGIRWIDARPPHTESGLASRAVFGTAPNFGAGKAVDAVVGRMLTAIVNDEKDLPTSAF